MRRRRGGDEHGLAVIYLALTITSILLAGAFAVDLGYWYVRAQQLQRAADAAALAGVVWMPADYAQATIAARASAAANGFVEGLNSVHVQVSQGDTPRQLAVRIADGNVPRFLSSIASSDQVSIGRRAVAQYELPVPLGSPENQFGGGQNGVYLAVNGFCARPPDGDNISSAYDRTDGNAIANYSCATPYAAASPSPPIRKNPDFRTEGYTYVVEVPPALSGGGCAVAPTPTQCSTTSSSVTIQVQDPKLSTTGAATEADQFNLNPATSCSFASLPGTTVFSVYKPDATPLDDSDNPILSPPGATTFSTEPAASSSWDPLVTLPAGSTAGRYLVRVHTGFDERCTTWSNAFGVRAQVGGTFSLCSTIPGSPLPSGYGFCPQVHGLDAMSLRATTTGATAALCKAAPLAGNVCNSFYLAQVDPAYAGRQMVITLYDPGEGAKRMRLLAPDGTPLAFDYKSIDAGAPVSGSVAAATGLNVASNPATPTVYPYDGRKLQLSATIPSTGLSTNGGWFKVEYEVAGAVAAVTDRTTWAVRVVGSPVRLIT